MQSNESLVTRHHVIIVTGQRDAIDTAYGQALLIMSATPDDDPEMAMHLASYGMHNLVTNPIRSAVNGFWTFMVGPDGGPEGGRYAEWGRELRARFALWLMQQTGYEWVKLGYGGNDFANILSEDFGGLPWARAFQHADRALKEMGQEEQYWDDPETNEP